MNHEIKIHPQYYARVANGSKTFEIRDNDRGYQSGDTVKMKEWDPEKQSPASTTPKGYTGSPNIIATVGYVHVLDSSRVVFSLLNVKKEKSVKSSV